MFRKALIAATAAGALALGIGAFATPADAYVRFGVYVGRATMAGTAGRIGIATPATVPTTVVARTSITTITTPTTTTTTTTTTETVGLRRESARSASRQLKSVQVAESS